MENKHLPIIQEILTGRRLEIVEVAVELLASGGARSLTMRAIADRVGVSEAALYRHFSGKSAIMSAVLDVFEDVASDVLSGALEDSDAGVLDRVGKFFEDRCARFAENPSLAKVMVSEENFQEDPELAERLLQMMRSHRRVIGKIIAEGVESGEIRGDVPEKELFRIIFGALRLLVRQWCLGGFSFDLKGEGKDLWSVLRRMLSPPPMTAGGKSEMRNPKQIQNANESN